jgi:hypothetical protein
MHCSKEHLYSITSSALVNQAHLLDQVVTAVKETRVDALVIAGDIFDRQNPKREAVALQSQHIMQTQCSASQKDVLNALIFQLILLHHSRRGIAYLRNQRPSPLCAGLPKLIAPLGLRVVRRILAAGRLLRERPDWYTRLAAR